MEPENEVIKYLINEQDMDDREYWQTVVHESTTTSQTSSWFAQLSKADLEQVLADSTSKNTNNQTNSQIKRTQYWVLISAF